MTDAYEYGYNRCKNNLDKHDVYCRLRDMVMDHMEKTVKEDKKEMEVINSFEETYETGENKVWSSIEDGVSDRVESLLNLND